MKLDSRLVYTILNKRWDAIVVEGYDGVGKGKVLSDISDYIRVVPYRPDYNLWQKYDIKQPDRWKISGFFWDIFSHFNNTSGSCSMLFDRGIISGAVYNNDPSIAKDYKSLLRDMQVLHVLVTCSEGDYKKFARLRTTEDVDVEYAWRKYKEYTERYLSMLELSGVDFIIYENKYDPELAIRVEDTCEGCGHYSYGVCRHPRINKEVEKNSLRCRLSTDKEVQDSYDTSEMQCV